MSTTERWLPVPGFDGYEVSDLGRVMSHKGRQPRIMRPGPHPGGYAAVGLRRERRTHPRLVHHLVAEAFHGPRPDGFHVLHNDGNPANNAASNLRYGTASDNMRDAVRHGVHAKASKTHCPQGHAYSGDNLLIDKVSAARRCRTCRNASSRAAKQNAALRAAGIEAA